MMRVKDFKSISKHAGFTLLELIIALGLSAAIMVGLIQMFMVNLSNERVTNSLTTVQESGRMALSILDKSFRMAGYMGCLNSLNPSKIDSLIDSTSADFNSDLHNYLNIFSMIDNYAASPALVFGDNFKQPVIGSDIFYNRSAMRTDMKTTVKNAVDATEIDIEGRLAHHVVAGDVLMITDCSTAHIFVASAVTSTTASSTGITTLKVTLNTAGDLKNTRDNLNVSYEVGSNVMIMNSYQYFLAKSDVTPGNSLFRYDSRSSDSAVELVPYIESLQFRYSTDNDAELTLNATGDGVLNSWALPPEPPATILSAKVNGAAAAYSLTAGVNELVDPSQITMNVVPSNGDKIEVVYTTPASDIGPDIYMDATQLETDGINLNSSIYGIETIIIAVGQSDIGAPLLTSLPPELSALTADGVLRKRYSQ